MREKFESILKKNGVRSENVEDVLYAVSDMLCCLQDKIKEKEPYATHTINSLEAAAQEVDNLIWEI